MSNKILFLYFGISVLSFGPVQAADQEASVSQPKIDDPDVFATVNGESLGMNLYRFLQGSRDQESTEGRVPGDGFDAELHRQQMAKDLVMTELLAQHATEIGMHESELVKVEMAMAEKTLLAQLYVKQLMDSIVVSESEIRTAYDQQNEQVMYRFMIWRTADKTKAVDMLNLLKAGKTPDATDAIETPWLRDVDIAPEVNAIVRELTVDEFAAEPVFQDGLWKVVQVIDKQIPPRQSYEDAKEIIKAELVSLKLDQKLEALAERATIVFNDQYVTQPTQ